MSVKEPWHNVDHGQNIIEVHDVAFAYGSNQVLDHISLQIHQGYYLGIVGPNGAGKTTLLKVMLGLLPLQQGSVYLFGQPLNRIKEWPRIGYVPQKAMQADMRFPVTVGEVVRMGRFAKAGLFHALSLQDKKIAQQALEQVGMEGYQHRLIGDLSGGQQQRVFIARALASQPDIIFLDEPTAGIDQKSQDDFYALLKKFNESLKITVVMVSHDIERLTREAMHIACVDEHLVYHGSAQEFLQESHSVAIDGERIKVIEHHHH